jgi:hypothetical protein
MLQDRQKAGKGSRQWRKGKGQRAKGRGQREKGSGAEGSVNGENHAFDFAQSLGMSFDFAQDR